MHWSRVGILSVIAMMCLSFVGVANASMMVDENEYYNGFQFRDIPASVAPSMYKTCYHWKHHHRWHHVCKTYQAVYVCRMYTYTITPQYRSASCTQWQVEWKRVHNP